MTGYHYDRGALHDIPIGGYRIGVSHTQRNKKQLVDRIRRIRGQLNSVEAALERGADCSDIMQRLAACRGAMNSLVVEVIDDHIRVHIADPARDSSRRGAAADELIGVVRSYFK